MTSRFCLGRRRPKRRRPPYEPRLLRRSRPLRPRAPRRRRASRQSRSPRSLLHPLHLKLGLSSGGRALHLSLPTLPTQTSPARLLFPRLRPHLRPPPHRRVRRRRQAPPRRRYSPSRSAAARARLPAYVRSLRNNRALSHPKRERRFHQRSSLRRSSWTKRRTSSAARARPPYRCNTSSVGAAGRLCHPIS